jgi:hypothetical protein
VLVITAEPAVAGPDAIDFARLATPLVVLRDTDGTEHLLLRDGAGRLRIDIVGGTALAGPVVPHVALAGLDAIGPRLLALRRLRGLSRRGHLPRTLFAREQRAPRWTMMLRLLDGLDDGASQRDIAGALFGPDRVAAEWRGASDHLRLAVQRLGREARRLVSGGYRALLRGPDRL